MSSRITGPFRSLVVRLLVPLFLTVAAVLGAYAVYSFGTTRSKLLEMFEGTTERCSGLIRRATHDGMLLNRLDDVQSTIERLAEGPDVIAIRVVDKEGAVILSATRDEIGHEIPLDTAPCQTCHLEGAALAEAPMQGSARIRLPDGRRVLRQVLAIENEPSCVAADCHPHPADAGVLGVLDVEVSMEPLESTVRRWGWQLVGTTSVLLLVVGVVATVFVRRVVGEPLARLQGATERIAAGDLSARVDVEGAHELARLAASFNRMSEDLRAARKELTGWSESLEDKVVSKTAELQRTQRQVLHMEKMASLGKLAATVAHELNNPLTGVLTYSRLVTRELRELSLEAGLREELERYLDLIGQESRRCGEIVKNLLLFARRRGAELAPIDLNEEVGRSLMLVRHHLEISGIRLTHRPFEGDARLIADAGQLQQALVALLVNAVEAMRDAADGDGEIIVTVGASGEDLTVDIGDTGPGIPPDVLPQIFEPFYSTKDEESRVGLGLAVVYGIVRRHGGTIDVESEIGAGSVFHLRLPRRPPAAAAADEGGEEER